jgi:hypothetical protein
VLIILKISGTSSNLLQLQSYNKEESTTESKKRRDKYEKDDPPAKKLRSEVEKSVADVEKTVLDEKTAEEETVECRVCMKSVEVLNCPKVTESCKHENLVCGNCLIISESEGRAQGIAARHLLYRS